MDRGADDDEWRSRGIPRRYGLGHLLLLSADPGRRWSLWRMRAHDRDDAGYSLSWRHERLLDDRGCDRLWSDRCEQGLHSNC